MYSIEEQDFYVSKDVYDVACYIAEKAHRGQLDKANCPYIKHPMRIANKFTKYAYKTVAILHDTIEDTWVTEEFLRSLFPDIIVDAVVELTRKENESYGQFIERLCQDREIQNFYHIARAVKIEDINDNLDLSRLNDITDEDLDRCKKYFKFRKKLIDHQIYIDSIE